MTVSKLALGGEADQIDLQPGAADALVRQPVHFQRRIEPGERFDPGLVVMAHVEAGADADLQHPSMRQRHDLGALAAHRLDAARRIDQVGQQRSFVPVGLHLPPWPLKTLASKASKVAWALAVAVACWD